MQYESGRQCSVYLWRPAANSALAVTFLHVWNSLILHSRSEPLRSICQSLVELRVSSWHASFVSQTRCTSTVPQLFPSRISLELCSPGGLIVWMPHGNCHMPFIKHVHSMQNFKMHFWNTERHDSNPALCTRRGKKRWLLPFSFFFFLPRIACETRTARSRHTKEKVFLDSLHSGDELVR